MDRLPVLETSRLSLRPVLPGDQDFIFKGLSHPEVIPFYGVSYTTFEETASQMEFYERVWRERTGAYWLTEDRITQVKMGVCGFSGYHAVHLKAEIGAWLLPEFWQKGIMTEALRSVINFAFQNWILNRLEAVVEVGNIASSSLVKKLGFTYEGTLRESEIKNGQPIDLEIYRLLKKEFLSPSSNLPLNC